MGKKEKRYNILKRLYKHIRDEVIPSKGECPLNDTFYQFVHKELNKKEREEFEGHMLCCSECMEKLEIIREIEQIESSLIEVPEELYTKAREILCKGHCKQIEDKTISKKIILLWDQLHDKITQITPGLARARISEKYEFRPIRKSQSMTRTFPCTITEKMNKDKILLEINRSGKKDYLTLKIFFNHTRKKNITNIWVSLYKSNRICSEVNLRDNGEAFFPRIKMGEYSLKFFQKDELLGEIEITIITERNEH